MATPPQPKLVPSPNETIAAPIQRKGQRPVTKNNGGITFRCAGSHSRLIYIERDHQIQCLQRTISLQIQYYTFPNTL